MLLSLLAVASALQVTRATGDEQCVYLPQYRALQRVIAGLPSETALPKLYDYATDSRNENPAGCDAADIDREISSREQSSVTLNRGGTQISPQAFFDCDRFVSRSIVCNGHVADGTGQPNGPQIVTPLPISASSGTISIRVPGTRLIGLYRSTLLNIQSGRPAIKLKGNVIPPMQSGSVLIALFDGLKNRRYGKAVWYF